MLFLAEASFMLLKTSNVPYNSIQIHYEIFMRRSIFHRHKPHKLADRLRPVSADPIGLTNENGKVHDGVTQLRKKLGGKNLKIGAIITLIAGVVAWVGQNRTPPLPITEQALTLPNSSTTKATTNEEATPSTAPAKAPAVALPPVNAVAVTKVAHNNIQPPWRRPTHKRFKAPKMVTHKQPLACSNQHSLTIQNQALFSTTYASYMLALPLNPTSLPLTPPKTKRLLWNSVTHNKNIMCKSP